MPERICTRNEGVGVESKREKNHNAVFFAEYILEIMICEAIGFFSVLVSNAATGFIRSWKPPTSPASKHVREGSAEG